METIGVAIVGSHRLMRELVRNAVPGSDRRFVCVAAIPCDEQAESSDLRPDGGCVEEFLALHQLSKPATDWSLLVIPGGGQAHLLDALVTRRSCGFLSLDNSLDALLHAAILVASGGPTTMPRCDRSWRSG